MSVVVGLVYFNLGFDQSAMRDRFGMMYILGALYPYMIVLDLIGICKYMDKNRDRYRDKVIVLNRALCKEICFLYINRYSDKVIVLYTALCEKICVVIYTYSPVENKNDLELDFKVFFFTDSCCSDIVHDESI